MKKSLIATITTAMFVLSLLAPVMFSQKAYAVAPDPASWYMKVDGVLDTDYYSLYPYEAESIKLGFSKFGELIDNNTNVGIEYAGARDPWAEPAGSSLDIQKLPKRVWINGWFLDITYNHSSWGLRNLWAGALFGDLSDYGKPWLHVQAPQSCTYEWQESFLKPGYEINDAGAITGTVLMNGGRKTNATATTDPITVLYHGPRKFIATLETHIWDINEQTNATLNVVNVMFTIIFDKVSKEVVIYKEVKVVDQAKYQISPLRVTVGTDPTQLDVPFGILCQFSNREEWDLGTNLTTPKYASYVHFYTQGTALGDSYNEGLYTPYDSLYTVLPTLPANTSVVGQRLGGNGTNAWGPEPLYERSSTYDVAQMISNDKKYVGFAAYWPSLSDWSADAGGGRRDLWYRAIGYNDIHDIDSFATPNDEPFLAPLTVGEWDFMLADDHKMVGPITADIHFRAVSVYGLTDLNDGTDNNFIGSPGNWIDREVMYQLQQVFAPWDLESVLEKKDYGRWVTKETGDGTTKNFFYLKYSDLYPVKGFTMDWPFVINTEFAWYNNFDGYYNLDQSMYDWTGYNYDQPNFGERVLVHGVLMERGVDYFLGYDGQGYMYINFTTAPALNWEVKILFSATNHVMNGGQWEWEVVGKDSNSIDSEGAAMVANFVADWTGNIVQMTGSEMQNTAYGPLAPYILDPLRTALLPDRRGYRDAEISFNHGRLALKDDWSCHKDESGDWLYGLPIASSNIITIGGPYANIATEYTNDFTDALVTLPGWTGTGLPQLNIFATSCWSKNTYAAQYDEGAQTVGYGVISTFRDINGTVWFVVYGYTGQDTYYTTWALLHSDVMDLAWELMPSGVTTVILEFDYTLHPTDYCFVTIKEALGTISEFDAQVCFLEHMQPSAPQQAAPAMWLPFSWWPTTWVTDKFPTIHKDP
ncbi:MAG TPA: hypothetical protein VMW36_00945 [Patescibacteria group bacterium]|nr:hypothetical protein [Patescibacteria group bacterium]